MQHLEVSGGVRPLKWPLGVKWLKLANLCVALQTTVGSVVAAGCVGEEYDNDESQPALSDMFSAALDACFTCFGSEGVLLWFESSTYSNILRRFGAFLLTRGNVLILTL